MDAKSLIQKHAKTSAEFTFRIGDDTLRARVLSNAAEVLALEKRARQMVRAAENRPAPGWRPYLPASADVIRMAVYAESAMVDPPMTFIEGLQMAHTCGLLLAQIVTPILEQAAVATVDTEEDEIEEAKNG